MAENFRQAVELSRKQDPMPTLQALAASTGLSLEAVIHHALVRYASDGAEALLAIDPWSLRELIEARRSEDWVKVGSLIDWLEAGLNSERWRRTNPRPALPAGRRSPPSRRTPS
jgi:hypothetical protein